MGNKDFSDMYDPVLKKLEELADQGAILNGKREIDQKYSSLYRQCNQEMGDKGGMVSLLVYALGEAD